MQYKIAQQFFPTEVATLNSEQLKSNFLELKTDYNNIVDTEKNPPPAGIVDVTQKDGSGDRGAFINRRESAPDVGVTLQINDGSQLTFYNEYINFAEQLKSQYSYYFHGKIRRTKTDQTFYIKLINDNEVIAQKTQYIKTINIAQGEGWADVEFIFTPIADFTGLFFDLKREASDYLFERRYAIIAYLELSQITNASFLKDKQCIKLGVQGRPGTLMCINGEEIRISKMGIYEVRNGIINVDFFALVSAAVEAHEDNLAKRWMDSVDVYIKNIDDQGLPPQQSEPLKAQVYSAVFNNTAKIRTTNSTTVDYMYKSMS